MSPFDNFSMRTIIRDDLVWYNIGNMLFPYSMWRTLLTPETEIDKFCRVNPDDADCFNESYDAFVIPLANAFRPSFMPQMQRMTKLISRMKIPCVVTGVGLQLDVEPNFSVAQPFDETVKHFCSAVLEKSAMIGVRGEITAAYLKKLGFGERHVTAIGCPSMYSRGPKLPFREPKPFSEDLRVALSTHATAPEKIHTILNDGMTLFPNHHLIVQDLHELKLLYYGAPFSSRVKATVPEHYLSDATHPLYINDRVRSFISVERWVSFLEKKDFTFGCRIHGNVASILAGTPALVFAPDSRIRELSEYHNIPHLRINEITDDFNLAKTYESTDFAMVLRGHEQRFQHFLSFLEANGLNHIYKDNPAGIDCPYDQKMKQINLYPEVQTLFGVQPKYASKRINCYYSDLYRREEKLHEQLDGLKRK